MAAGNIKGDVLRMYLNHPYPNYSAAERRAIFPAELARYRFLGLEPFLPGSRLIDVGCGTGHRVMPMAQHFGVREYVGFDHSTTSLDVARALAAELQFTKATFAEGDLFTLPYPDESFDVVISQGVLHHTSDPLRGFRELVRICKPNGFVAIYLYNKWNHWRHNLQKQRVNRLAGDDVEKRFDVAYGLYGNRPLAELLGDDAAGDHGEHQRGREPVQHLGRHAIGLHGGGCRLRQRLRCPDHGLHAAILCVVSMKRSTAERRSLA